MEKNYDRMRVLLPVATTNRHRCDDQTTPQIQRHPDFFYWTFELLLKSGVCQLRGVKNGMSTVLDKIVCIVGDSIVVICWQSPVLSHPVLTLTGEQKLDCIALYCTLLHCTLMHCTLLQCTLLLYWVCQRG